MSPKRHTTSASVPVTDQLIDKLAAEAERGYEPATIPGRPRLGAGPSEIVPVRLDPLLRRALEQRADEEHTTQSVIHRALRRYLHVA
jgi:CRISPR-associated endonuclease/helicase Cas3